METSDTSRLAEILSERHRQDRLKTAGRFTHTCADALTNLERFVILTREFGEVARAVAVTCDRRPELTSLTTADLRTELIQVAAVSLAWIEGLDKETEAADAFLSSWKCPHCAGLGIDENGTICTRCYPDF